AAAIRLLLGDAALRARLGEAAAARIRERFDWRRAARQTEAVYQEVLGRTPTPRPAALSAS
ncbi:MAG TPA: glycosyltransferase family 1 protein, partial [Dehalococcoidia bacterium]